MSNVIGLWLIDNTGIPLLNRLYSQETSLIDSTLFSGFITAIVAFSRQVVNDSIETIEMGGHNIHYLPFDQFCVVTTTIKNSNTVSLDLHPVMTQIGNKFQSLFQKELNEAYRDPDNFVSFESYIDDIIGEKDKAHEKSLNDFDIGLILTEIKFNKINTQDAINKIYASYKKLDKKSQAFIKEAMKDFEVFFTEKAGLSKEELRKYQEIVGKMSSLMKSERFFQAF